MFLRSLKNRSRARLILYFGIFIKFFRVNSKKYAGNNIVIFHQGRCGSTLLEKKLTGSISHKIFNFSEIYSQSYIPMESGLDNMITRLSQTTNFYNKFYEVKYGVDNHLSFSMEDDLIKLVKNNCKFVLLVRKDSMSQAKSMVYGLYRNKDFHFKLNTKVDFEKIVIKAPFLIGGRFYSDLNELANFIDYQTEMIQKFLKKLSAKYEIIYYEDLISSEENVANSLGKFLGEKKLIFKENIKTQKTPINYDEKLYIKD